MAETMFKEETVRSPRRGRDRASVESKKQNLRAQRDRDASEELHNRIIRVLQLLVGRGDIKTFCEAGKRPDDPQLTVVFTVTRPGKKEPVVRGFFATYTQRLCGMIPAETRCAPILVTHEMRDERIAERISALFNN